jgi:hypothetical protein
MTLRLRPRGKHRRAAERRGGDRGIVDDAVDDHVDHGIRHRDRIGRNLRDLPGELILPRQLFVTSVYSNLV